MNEVGTPPALQPHSVPTEQEVPAPTKIVMVSAMLSVLSQIGGLFFLLLIVATAFDSFAKSADAPGDYSRTHICYLAMVASVMGTLISSGVGFFSGVFGGEARRGVKRRTVSTVICALLGALSVGELLVLFVISIFTDALSGKG
jgi:hypothetical protein